ncbi:MAG: MATE family efflux transporter [Lachnospiraceae bacterium]
METQNKKGKSAVGKKEVNLMEGSIAKGMLTFAIPMFLGQLLQQLYNLADAWVIGNFADNDAFAAVSSAGSLTFLIIGFFNGIAIGGGVVISRYFGAGNKEYVVRSIHTNVLFGLIASVLSTLVGLLLVPQLLVWMKTPESVLPQSLLYFRIYFAGVATVIMYNICMSIMRALGDSVHPLYYLIFSSILNVVLDLLFVAVFHWGVGGAAVATVISQGLSTVLCLIRMCRSKEYTRLDFRKLRWYNGIMGEVIRQGLPTGIQNSVISIGNMVVQTNINTFGSFAMSGYGAYAKIEGFVFLPITSMSMTLPTFISQNLGARKYDRAKRGAVFGIVSGVVMAELFGFLFYFGAPYALRLFVDAPEAIAFGTTQARTVSLFFFLLAFSHCAAGVLRGCGKSIVPMITMLMFWCGVRILYVTQAVKLVPQFQTISWAYPLTWSLSSIVFLVFLLKSDWTHYYEKKQ